VIAVQRSQELSTHIEQGADSELTSTSAEDSLPATVGTISDGAHLGGGQNGQDAYSGRIIPCPLPHKAR
jgi:hypothetical protein